MLYLGPINLLEQYTQTIASINPDAFTPINADLIRVSLKFNDDSLLTQPRYVRAAIHQIAGFTDPLRELYRQICRELPINTKDPQQAAIIHLFASRHREYICLCEHAKQILCENNNEGYKWVTAVYGNFKPYVPQAEREISKHRNRLPKPDLTVRPQLPPSYDQTIELLGSLMAEDEPFRLLIPWLANSIDESLRAGSAKLQSKPKDGRRQKPSNRLPDPWPIIAMQYFRRHGFCAAYALLRRDLGYIYGKETNLDQYAWHYLYGILRGSSDLCCRRYIHTAGCAEFIGCEAIKAMDPSLANFTKKYNTLRIDEVKIVHSALLSAKEHAKAQAAKAQAAKAPNRRKASISPLPRIQPEFAATEATAS